MMSAIDACGAWKGRGGRSGVNYGGLTLGRVSYPNVNVVGAVSLVEGAELLGLLGSAEDGAAVIVDGGACFLEVPVDNVLVG